MSLFKKLLGGKEESSASPIAQTTAAPTRDAALPFHGHGIDSYRQHSLSHLLDRAGSLIDCVGIDWNAEAQLSLVREVLPKWKHEWQTLATERADGFRADNPFISLIDAAVMYSLVCDHIPTRLMEIGCGYSTLVMRRALKAHTLPGELIAIDPDPRADITEAYDAFLDQPAQTLPLSDFEMLRTNEWLIIDSTHVAFPGGEIEFLFQHVLPRLNTGVLVGMHGIRLPRHYTREEISAGFNEQALLQMFLTNNPRVEILYAGGWMIENHKSELEQLFSGTTTKMDSRALWFRIR